MLSFFFFSSRRRHTRCSRDWSSDVCSSDLDVGSLALGGAIGTVAVIIKQELLLIFIGGVFVAEGLSVIIQVASFKLRGKRVFKMAPLHHHFELQGWSESKVIIRFWIASLILSLFSLSTLKLR